MKEATVLNPDIDYKLYREEMDRLAKRLELQRQMPERKQRQMPERKRRHLPHVRLSFMRRRRHQRLAEPSGC